MLAETNLLTCNFENKIPNQPAEDIICVLNASELNAIGVGWDNN